MTNYPSVVVPAVPPRPPQLSLLNSAVTPGNGSDPSNPVFELGADQLELLPDDLRSELEARKGDAWVRGFTYAPENHWEAEVRDPCDYTTVDAPALNAPTGVNATPETTGGTLTAGSYEYEVTAVNANGETTVSSAATATTTGTTGSVKVTWQPVADGVTYKVYGRASGSMGLLATVGPFTPDNPPAWTDTGSGTAGAPAPTQNTTAGPGPYANQAINVVVPYLIVAEDWCSSFGFEERDFKGRALRLLENGKHKAIEKEFWAGALTQAKGYPNRYLTDANLVDLTPGGGAPSVARGLQILQDYLQQTGFGGQGMIHVQAQTAPNLLGARRVGNLLLDIFDNIIVPGTGYTGSAPAIGGGDTATTAVMIATDLVMAREESEGTVFPDSFAEALDRGQAGQPNTIRFRAEKFGAAYFDGAVQGAVRVTLAT